HAHEQVIRDAAKPRSQPASHADHSACELRADQPGSGWPVHTAIVHADVKSLTASAQRRLQFIAPIETAFAGKLAFPIEPAHRVAATDGQVIYVIEPIIGELPAECRDIAERLACHLERHGKVGVQHCHAEAPGRTVYGSQRVSLSPKCADALPEAQ